MKRTLLALLLLAQPLSAEPVKYALFNPTLGRTAFGLSMGRVPIRPLPAMFEIICVGGVVGCGGGGAGVSLSATNVWTGSNTFTDSLFFVVDDGDPSKKIAFQASGITTATTRTFTVPNISSTLCVSGLDCAPSVTWSFNQVNMNNNQLFYGGSGSFATGNQFFYNVTETPDTMFIGVATTSESINIAEYGDSSFDLNNGPCGTSACVDPTLIIHSHNQSTSQWVGLTNNATDAVLSSSGGLDLTGIPGAFKLARTVTTGGTTGAQTINKISGTVNFAAAATSVVVTDSLVNTSSIIFTTIRTADTTCTSVKSVVPASGSFTITMIAGCAAETSVGFLVDN